MVIFEVKANIGEGRQRAGERMGNKRKNITQKPFGKVKPKSIYPMSLTVLLTNRRVSISLGKNAQRAGRLRPEDDRSAGLQGGSL